MYPLLLCRGAMPEIILTTIRPPSSGPTHPDYPDFPHGIRKKAAFSVTLTPCDVSRRYLDTMMLQWWYNDNPGVECGKEGSQLCLYSLAGAKWEIIAAGGTLHRLESIHTANTDRKGLRPVKCSIWSDQNSEYSLFQGRQEKLEILQ